MKQNEEKADLDIVESNNQDKNIIGIAINTKLCNAVKRNRIKRLIRENYKNFEERIKTRYKYFNCYKQRKKY